MAIGRGFPTARGITSTSRLFKVAGRGFYLTTRARGARISYEGADELWKWEKRALQRKLQAERQAVKTADEMLADYDRAASAIVWFFKETLK